MGIYSDINPENEALNLLNFELLQLLKSCAVSKKTNVAIISGVDAIVDDKIHDVRIPTVHPVSVQGRTIWI